MNKPYLLFKTKHSPFLYAQVRLPDGTISRNRLKIENPNEKREHVATDEYILSKNPELKNEVYALTEKLLSDIKEVDSEKELMIDWEKELINREESANLKENELKRFLFLWFC